MRRAIAVLMVVAAPLAGAQERVARPWRYALGRGISRLERAVSPARTAR